MCLDKTLYDVIFVDNIHDNINVLDLALWKILKLNVFLCNLKQEAQLSQKDRATLRVIEYFAYSLTLYTEKTINQTLGRMEEHNEI